MSYYAFLDENNLVVEVITGIAETELIEGKDPETWYGEFRRMNCKRTSPDLNFRKNFASVGDMYDPTLDAFITKKPFDSWILNNETARWQAPVDYPNDGLIYNWDESAVAWELCVDCNQNPKK